MEIKYNKLSECNYEVVVSIPYSEMVQDFEDAFEKERKSITYPGFRKGKVPMSIMKRVFKNDIEINTAQKQADKFIEEALKDSEYQLLNKHILKDIQIKENVEYFVDIEVIPVLDLKDYKNLEIEKKNYVITDSYVKDVIKDISKKDADFQDEEVVGDKYHVVFVKPIDMEKYSDEDYALLDDIEKARFDFPPTYEVEKFDNITFPFDISAPGIKKSVTDLFIGKKVGEEVVVSQKHEHGEGEHKHVHEVTVKFLIIKIVKLNFVELTEEKIAEYTKDKAKTYEEFKQLVLTDYQNYYSKLASDEANNKLYLKIIENNKFEAPYRFLSETLNQLVQKEKKQYSSMDLSQVSDEMFANYLYPRALQQVAWFLVGRNIARVEDLKLSEEELNDLIQKQHEKTGISIDKLKSYYLESKRLSAELDEKIIKFVQENNTFVLKDIELTGE